MYILIRDVFKWAKLYIFNSLLCNENKTRIYTLTFIMKADILRSLGTLAVVKVHDIKIRSSFACFVFHVHTYLVANVYWVCFARYRQIMR